MTPIVYHRLLNTAEQRALGVETPAPLAMAGHVHHDECDALNHVNNTTYMVWFERLRIAFMEHYALGQLGDPTAPRIVIRSGDIHWTEEMLRGEDYVVTTRCTALRRTSFSLAQTVWAEGRKRATFACVMVLLTPDGATRMPIPEDARAGLIADGARPET